MGDGRDPTRFRARFSDEVTRTAISAKRLIATMAQKGLCLSYRYETGRFYLTKGKFSPCAPTPENFDQDALNWLLERGLLADAGEPDDENECRYFLTAEGRRQGKDLPR